MSNNYPPGSANDPRAPWNQKDPEMTEWEQSGTSKQECVCCGEIEFLDDEKTCKECFVPEEVEDDEEDGGFQAWDEDML